MTGTRLPARATGTAPTAGEIMARARDVIEAAHQAAIDGLPSTVRLVAGYHIGWWDADCTPRRSAGKALRPALVLLCAAAAGAPDLAPAIPAAVAIELVHDFSLLHDDVMDGDTTRRHRPAAWTQFGIGRAVLTGDALLTCAIRQVADGPHGDMAARIVADALHELCRGQAADLAFEQRNDVGLDECLAMAADKTGALLGAACRLGALAAGADPVAVGHYRRFGQELGVAFQLVDDLLGIWGDPRASGKPAGSDLAARKKSLPVAAALVSGTPEGERLRALYRGRESFEPSTIRLVADLVDRAGGRAWAECETAKRVQSALDALDEAGPRPQPADDLRTLTRYLTGRDH